MREHTIRDIHRESESVYTETLLRNFFESCEKHDSNKIKKLLKDYTILNEEEKINAGFSHSIISGNMPVFEYLFDKCELTHSSNEPLIYACRHGRIDMVKMLVEKGKVPYKFNSHSDEYDEPIIESISNGHFDITHYLLDLGCRFDNHSVQSLCAACNAELLTYLISKGGDPFYDNTDKAIKNCVSITPCSETFNVLIKCPGYEQVINEYDVVRRCLNGVLYNEKNKILVMLLESRPNCYEKVYALFNSMDYHAMDCIVTAKGFKFSYTFLDNIMQAKRKYIIEKFLIHNGLDNKYEYEEVEDIIRDNKKPQIINDVLFGKDYDFVDGLKYFI